MKPYLRSPLRTLAPRRWLVSNVADVHIAARAIALVVVAASCASEPSLDPSIEDVVDAGAMPPPTSDFGRPPGGNVAPAGPTWKEDLDLDGIADSDVFTGPCEAALDRGTTCLGVRSTRFGKFEIPVHIDPQLRFGQVIEAGAMGRFGGALQRWYVYFTKYSTASQESESAAVYVFDLQGRNVVAATSSPEGFPGNWPSFGVYFSKVRAPGGQRLPFIAPGQSNILNQTQRFPASNTGISAPPAMKLAGKDVSPFSFLCIYSPTYVGSNPFCGTFKAVQVHARYSDPSIPADYGDYNYRVQLRMNGGFLLDVNHDGYEDIHLPFLGLLKTIDGAGAVAAPSASTWTDLPDATLVESYILSTPTNPTLINNNAGRLYATMRGLPDRDGAVLFAGQTTGSFKGYWGATCNSINFLLSYRVEASEGFRFKQRWAQRYRWANPVVKQDGSKQIESPGPGLDGCLHRYADGVASWGAKSPGVILDHDC